jgi:UDP-glucose 4-epimerase
MRILITGGSGFIGRHLVNYWSDKHDLVVMGRNLAAAEFLSQKNVRFVQGDICNRNEVFSAVRNADIVVHLASTTIPATSNDDCIFDVSTNLIGSLNILEACVAHKAKKIIFSSSGGTVYGNSYGKPLSEDSPLNPICSYGIVKVGIEKYIQMYHRIFDLPYAILRISNPFGPGHHGKIAFGAISIFMEKIMKGEEIEVWGDGTIARDFIFTDDLVRAFDKALDCEIRGLLVNIGSGYATSLNKVLADLGTMLKSEPKVRYLKVRPFDVKVSFLNIERAMIDLGWQPGVSLTEGLKLMAKYFHAES